MLHKSALSVKPLKKQIFLAFARGFRLYGKSILLSTSEVESLEIKKSLGNPEIRFAPNIPIRPHEIFNGETTFKNNGKPVEFLFLGRISPEKNPINLLRALQNINKPCKVTFCGSFLDKSYLTRFQEELARVKLPVICEYIGDIPHPIVKDLIRTNDVLVLPSLGENFGHSIFESFVSAVPVIIGNNTPWKSIESIKAGIEVNPDDINEISSAIQRFIQMDIDEYLLWKKGAYDLSISYFESNNFEQIYLKLFS